MVIPTVSPFSSLISHPLTLGKNEWHHTVVYHKLDALVSCIKVSIPNNTEIIDSTQTATGEYFAIVDYSEKL